MSKKPLITVFGATGHQGSSVVEALLHDGRYSIRGITRDLNGAKAKELASRGVEMVKADVSGPLEDLVKVLKGSEGAFLMTNFWDPSVATNELEYGKKLVDAAKEAKVKHIVWSTLPNVEKISNGKYDVPHFTLKAKTEEYIRDLQRLESPFEYVTFVAPAFYYQNFQTFFKPRMEKDTLIFTMPNVQNLIAFDVNEMGHSVLAAFRYPTKHNLKRIDFYGEEAPLKEYIRKMGKILGKKVRLEDITFKEYSKKEEELSEMLSFFHEYTYYGTGGNRKSGQDLTPGGLSSFDQYLEKQKESLTSPPVV